MKWIKLWEKIGKQPTSITQFKDVIVEVNGKQYFVIKPIYNSGELLRLQGIEINCKTCKNNIEYPPPHTCDVCTALDSEDYEMWKIKT